MTVCSSSRSYSDKEVVPKDRMPLIARKWMFLGAAVVMGIIIIITVSVKVKAVSGQTVPRSVQEAESSAEVL